MINYSMLSLYNMHTLSLYFSDKTIRVQIFHRKKTLTVSITFFKIKKAITSALTVTV